MDIELKIDKLFWQLQFTINFGWLPIATIDNYKLRITITKFDDTLHWKIILSFQSYSLTLLIFLLKNEQVKINVTILIIRQHAKEMSINCRRNVTKQLCKVKIN